MILMQYKACGHVLPIVQKDWKEETERAAKGEKCPRCRAEAQIQAEEKRV